MIKRKRVIILLLFLLIFFPYVNRGSLVILSFPVILNGVKDLVPPKAGRKNENASLDLSRTQLRDSSPANWRARNDNKVPEMTIKSLTKFLSSVKFFDEMPIKERRTKILLLLFLMTDESSDFVEINSLYQRVFDLTFNQKTKGTLSALLKEGLIEKGLTGPVGSFPPASAREELRAVGSPSTSATPQTESNRSPQYRLTDKGYQSLCLEFPFFRFLKHEWDGLWRVISYEIPETKREIRDRLRRQMRGWGLGPWHRSFWVTPHPIIENLRELVYGREEEKYIQAFESTHVFGDLNLFVEKVWEKTKLEKNYRELFRKWHDLLSSQKEKEEKIKGIISLYVEILRLDPGLPKSLVGQKWIALEAFSIFKEVKGILLK